MRLSANILDTAGVGWSASAPLCMSVDAGNIFSDAWDTATGWISDGLKAIGRTGADLVHWIDSTLESIGMPSLTAIVELNGWVKGAEILFSVAAGIATGGKWNEIFAGAWAETLSYAKTVAPYVQTCLSFIPGLGTGTAAALAAGLALASGEPLSDAALAAAAACVPGGAIAQQAFKSGAAAVVSLAQGQSIDRIAIDALREQVPDNPYARAAFDAGAALATGKSIQEATLAAARDLAGQVQIPGLPVSSVTASQVGQVLLADVGIDNGVLLQMGALVGAASQVIPAEDSVPGKLVSINPASMRKLADVPSISPLGAGSQTVAAPAASKVLVASAQSVPRVVATPLPSYSSTPASVSPSDLAIGSGGGGGGGGGDGGLSYSDLWGGATAAPSPDGVAPPSGASSAPAPASGGSNTALMVGGVAAAGLLAFMMMKGGR